MPRTAELNATPDAAPTPHPELTSGRRWAVLFSFVFGAALSILSQTTMTASLPSIIAEFGVSATLGQWLTTSYLLTLGVMIPCTGFLMTRFQSRHLFLVCGLIFLTGLLGAFAPSFPALVAVRCVQGLGAGVLVPLMQVVVFRLFPPQRRGFAMGVAALAQTAGPALGPVLAGVLTDAWGWRSIFLVTAGLTIVLLACYPVVRAFHERPGEASFDLPSLLLVAAGLAGVIIGVANLGAPDLLLHAVVPALAGAAALVLFARRQFSMEHPLLDLRPFGTPQFTLGVVAVMVVFGSLINVETFVCLYVQHDQGFSPTAAGLTLLPGTVLAAIISPFTGRVLDRRGPLGLSIAGFACVIASGVLNAMVTEGSPLWYSIAVFALRCVGNACILQHLITWAVNSVPSALMTHATAIANTLRQVGAALMNSLLFALMGVVERGSTELVGIKVSFVVSTALTCAMAVVTVGLMLRARARRA